MRELACEILVVGGGVGGCAAALAAADAGRSVIMAEPTAWIGGQFTSQAVPPDEHPHIESFGCTRSYRSFRERVRAHYRAEFSLSERAMRDPHLNPGAGWVSRLCFAPHVGVRVLEEMLAGPMADGRLTLLRRYEAVRAEADGDLVRSVEFRSLDSGERLVIAAKFVLDATETGDLLPWVGAEYRVGAESQSETGEPHALPGPSRPECVQGITWCFAMGFQEGADNTIERPRSYERWRAYRPDVWPGHLLSWTTQDVQTLQPRRWTLWGKDSPEGLGLFEYRRIVGRETLADPGAEEVSIVNWPQNDYFVGRVIDEPPEVVAQRLEDARELSLSLLYWLQTEAERPDGGMGYPELRLRPDITGTEDGLALAPYHRESRRIVAQWTVSENYVAAACNPGRTHAEPIPDSVGIGSYRIDLHPRTGGLGTIDIPSVLFQIPLRSLTPVRLRNLLPAAKNLGVTHIANGCYRLHPIEWNVGEAAGTLAAFCLSSGCEPKDVSNSETLLRSLQNQLRARGVELEWPPEATPPGWPY